jgi:uncharacterized protein YbjT (DUF2867 family)
VARILLVGGGSRGLRLTGRLAAQGHAVRVLARSPERRSAIEAAGGEWFAGDPDRLATLRGALEHVTVACWLLATATGDAQAVHALHESRLEQFLGMVVDSTVRGLVYEAGGSSVPRRVLKEGERIATDRAALHSIPLAILRAEPASADAWVTEALGAIDGLLRGALRP